MLSKQMLLRFLVVALATVAGTNSAHASVITGYNADQPSTAPPFTPNTYDARFDRFSTNFPSEAPFGNTSSSFLLAGRDLSGVGWLTGTPARHLTMISPQHFITVAHVGFDFTNGTSVSFLSTSNSVVNSTITNTMVIPSLGGSTYPNTDLLIGTLSAPLSGINYYPIATGTAGQYAGRQAYMYDQENRIGRNRIEGIFAADVPSEPVSSVLAQYNFDPTGPGGNNPGEFNFTVGDSGAPSFVITDNNILALIGPHSFQDTASSPNLIYDSLMAPYLNSINSYLAANGFMASTTPVPEPGSMVLLSLVAVGGVVSRRVRRNCAAAAK